MCLCMYCILICILLEKHENTLTRKHTHTQCIHTYMYDYIHSHASLHILSPYIEHSHLYRLACRRTECERLSLPDRMGKNTAGEFVIGQSRRQTQKTCPRIGKWWQPSRGQALVDAITSNQTNQLPANHFQFSIGSIHLIHICL